MSATTLQPSMTGGELAPPLYGRVDTARYVTALKRCRNFIVRPEGGVENRPGLYYCWHTTDIPVDHRLIPFVYSTEVSYVLFFGDGFVRFQSGGEDVVPDSTVYAGGTTYALDAYVTSAGVTYRSLQGANTGHAPAASPTWWVPDSGLQISHPWVVDQLDRLRYTQSADVMYFARAGVPPQTLRRLTPGSFTIGPHTADDGPFIDINSDESIRVAASAVLGEVTIDASADIFTPNAVGALFYIETKNLGQIKPWVVGDRGVAVGDLRRSDGKTYRATTVPAAGAWHETGPRTPVHENGRVWDGAGDTRSNGVDTWSTGIEWEFVDLGYGVVRLHTWVDANTMLGTVTKRLPAQVVGGVGAPANTWGPFAGNGTVGPYPLAGAGYGIFSVTIDGGGVSPDPNYDGGGVGGGGGGDDPYDPCPGIECVLPGHDTLAGGVVAGDILVLFDPETGAESTGEVESASTVESPMFRVVTSRGAMLPCSSSAPIPVRTGGFRTPTELMGQLIPITRGDGVVVWDVVCDIVGLGMGLVRHITMKGPVRVFWVAAPAEEGAEQWYIAHHNAKPTPS